MPQFGRIGELYTASVITGPKHVWLGLSFSTVPVSQSDIVERSPLGACGHGSIDPNEITKAVLAGVKDSGAGVFVSRIEYVADDTPDYLIYRSCALQLAQRRRNT